MDAAKVTTVGRQPLPETPDLDGAYPRLTDQQIEMLAAHGERRPTRTSEVLLREGERSDEFLVLLSGKVAIVQGYGEDEQLLRVHGPRRFLGELGLLEGQPSFFTAVVHEPGEILAVTVAQLEAVVQRDQSLGDLILRAYLIRRTQLIGVGAGFRIIGSGYSADSRRLLEFASRNRLPYRWIDLEKDPQAEALLRRFGIAADETPVVIWRGSRVLRNPSTAELAALLGLRTEGATATACDLLVVGAGPAGLAAAVYGASEGLDTAVLDSVATGGQAATSSRIENYLGFPAGISGAELAERAAIQARKFGARISVPTTATMMRRHDGHVTVGFDDGTETTCRALVLATGARYRKLDVPGIERLEGTSVYYAATLWEALMCRFDDIAVVGGGNSAGQAAVFLSDHVPRVYLLVRHENLGRDMSRYLVDRIERNPRIEVLLHTEVREAVGDTSLEALVVEDNRTGLRRTLGVRALFVFIGAQPHTAWLGDTVALDPHGFVLTGPDAAGSPDDGGPRAPDGHPLALETSVPGVFAVGDVRSGSVKRVASAVGEGAMAVRLVHQHLNGTGGAIGP
jgi:thioredoxin reductase (NADPH)